jgi:hypothetical protein
MADDNDKSAQMEGVTVEVFDPLVIDEMVGKIRASSAAPGAADAVDSWRAAHGAERFADIGHDHAVVGETLMYLHDAPDGTLVTPRSLPRRHREDLHGLPARRCAVLITVLSRRLRDPGRGRSGGSRCISWSRSGCSRSPDPEPRRRQRVPLR